MQYEYLRDSFRYHKNYIWPSKWCYIIFALRSLNLVEKVRLGQIYIDPLFFFFFVFDTSSLYKRVFRRSLVNYKRNQGIC